MQILAAATLHKITHHNPAADSYVGGRPQKVIHANESSEAQAWMRKEAQNRKNSMYMKPTAMACTNIFET